MCVCITVRACVRACVRGQVYPPFKGNKAKTAVRTLTMGVQHNQCFGMLGPNGAGKTTAINMLGGKHPAESPAGLPFRVSDLFLNSVVFDQG